MYRVCSYYQSIKATLLKHLGKRRGRRAPPNSLSLRSFRRAAYMNTAKEHSALALALCFIAYNLAQSFTAVFSTSHFLRAFHSSSGYQHKATRATRSGRRRSTVKQRSAAGVGREVNVQCSLHIRGLDIMLCVRCK